MDGLLPKAPVFAGEAMSEGGSDSGMQRLKYEAAVAFRQIPDGLSTLVRQAREKTGNPSESSRTGVMADFPPDQGCQEHRRKLMTTGQRIVAPANIVRPCCLVILKVPLK